MTSPTGTNVRSVLITMSMMSAALSFLLDYDFRLISVIALTSVQKLTQKYFQDRK